MTVRHVNAIATIILCSGLLLPAGTAAGAQASSPRSSELPSVTRPPVHSTAPADTLQLSLAEAVLSTLENNPDLLIRRLDPILAQAVVSEERAAFDPVLTASATRDESKTQRFLGSQPLPFELTTERTGYDAGIAMRLPTGTTLSVDAVVDGTTSSLYASQYSGNIGLTVTQSLLRGFGCGANLASLRRARLDLDISREELRAFTELTVVLARAAYWRLYLAAEEARIQEESLQLARRQMEESIARIEVGRLAEVELAAVRAEVARRESALIDAQSAYEQARLDFLYLVVAPGDGPDAWTTTVLPIDRPRVEADSLEDVAIHEEVAVRFRPDLAQARLAYAQGDLEVGRTKNGLLPRLDFFITLGRTTYADTFNDALPEIDSPFKNVNLGLTLEFPILNRAARAAARQAAATRDQLEQALVNMNRLIRKDVRSAHVEVGRTREQIEAKRVTRELEQVNLEAELEKFRVGRSTNLLVLQVQRDFTASQLEEVRAVVDYLNALDDFYLTEGTLLERRGIEVPGEM